MTGGRRAPRRKPARRRRAAATYTGYVINLDRRADRMREVSALLRTSGIDVRRMAAVDGSGLDLTGELLSRTHPWNLENIRDPRKLRGILGCCLSHLAVWREVAEMEDAYVFVFEDDVTFYHKDLDFAKAWEEIEAMLPEGFGLVWLNARTFATPCDEAYPGGNRIVPTTTSKTAEAYVVTPQFAKQLHDDIVANLGAADAHMMLYCNKVSNKSYELEVPLFCQRNVDSDIQSWGLPPAGGV